MDCYADASLMKNGNLVKKPFIRISKQKNMHIQSEQLMAISLKNSI